MESISDSFEIKLKGFQVKREHVENFGTSVGRVPYKIIRTRLLVRSKFDGHFIPMGSTHDTQCLNNTYILIIPSNKSDRGGKIVLVTPLFVSTYVPRQPIKCPKKCKFCLRYKFMNLDSGKPTFMCQLRMNVHHFLLCLVYKYV